MSLSSDLKFSFTPKASVMHERPSALSTRSTYKSSTLEPERGLKTAVVPLGIPASVDGAVANASTAVR